MCLPLTYSASLEALRPNPSPSVSSRQNFLTCFQVLRCWDPVCSVNGTQKIFFYSLSVCVLHSHFKNTEKYRCPLLPAGIRSKMPRGSLKLWVVQTLCVRLCLCPHTCDKCGLWTSWTAIANSKQLQPCALTEVT